MISTATILAIVMSGLYPARLKITTNIKPTAICLEDTNEKDIDI